MPRRRLAAVANVVLLLALPTAAQALTPPEIYVKEIDVSEQRVGEWQPLNGARLTSLTGYALGLKLQQDNPVIGSKQRILFQAAAVPDGTPDQPKLFGICVGPRGTAGTIVDTENEVRYEGNGAYTITAITSLGTDASNCTPGDAVSSSSTFTVNPVVSARIVGAPMLDDVRRTPPRHGLDVTSVAGAGTTDVHCAQNARTLPDGDLAGARVTKTTGGARGETNNNVVEYESSRIFTHAGMWSCVARAASGTGATPWSAPTPPVLVRRGFVGLANLRLRDGFGPRYRLTGEVDPDLAGGIITLVIHQPRCGFRIENRRPVRVRIRIPRSGRFLAAFRLPLPPGRLGRGHVVDTYFSGTRLSPKRSIVPDFRLKVERRRGRQVLGGTIGPCRYERQFL